MADQVNLIDNVNCASLLSPYVCVCAQLKPHDDADGDGACSCDDGDIEDIGH